MAIVLAAIATTILFRGNARPIANAIAFVASLVYAGLAAIVLTATH